MQHNDVVVRCEHVSRSFFSKDTGVNPVLQDINFQMDRGDFVVLIGPSGCGKSTLLNLIAGFDKPTAGKVLVNGAPVIGPGPDKAMVFQDYALLPWLNTRGNVEIGLRLGGIHANERHRISQEFLSLVGLGHVMDRPVYKLSGGMQQRVSIARALALNPAVLLMDEPFGALDAFQRAIMHKELSRIWKITNASIVFVTHSLEEALFLGNRVLAMAPGAVGLTGELAIDLPRPRDPMTAEFVALKRKLFAMLTAHITQRGEAFAE
jgi:NitT/TauT family transport system ATP-binding protein